MLSLIFFCILSVSAGPPVFNDDNWNIAAKENVLLKVRCSATGDPTYEWYNEETEAVGPHLNPPVWIEHGVDNGSQLVFNVTSRNHSGGYTCIAKNSYGLRSKVFEVNIAGKADDADIRVVKVSDKSVTFVGSPDSENVTYDVNYREIYEKRTTYYRVTAGKDGTFEIGNLLSSGQYTFNFSRRDDAGWKQSLVVTLLPTKPEVIFHSLKDGMLTFSWFRRDSDVLRKTIDKYQLVYRTVKMDFGSSWVYNSCNISIEIPSCSTAKYTIADLVMNTYYEIRLRAHTSAGYGEPYRNKVYIS